MNAGFEYIFCSEWPFFSTFVHIRPYCSVYFGHVLQLHLLSRTYPCSQDWHGTPANIIFWSIFFTKNSLVPIRHYTQKKISQHHLLSIRCPSHALEYIAQNSSPTVVHVFIYIISTLYIKRECHMTHEYVMLHLKCGHMSPFLKHITTKKLKTKNTTLNSVWF